MGFLRSTGKALCVVGSFFVAGCLVIGHCVMSVIGLIIGAITSSK